MQANRNAAQTSSGLGAGLGAALVGLGLFLFFAQLDALDNQFLHFTTGASRPVGGAALPAAIVVVQHLAHSWFFERAAALLEARQMLLSCWPFTLVLLGITLLGRRIGNLLMLPDARSGSSGVRDE